MSRLSKEWEGFQTTKHPFNNKSVWFGKPRTATRRLPNRSNRPVFGVFGMFGGPLNERVV